MRYGMSDEFPMMSLMSEGSRYLGGRGELTASEETFAKVDSIVKKLIADAYDEAKRILTENREKLDSISKFLIEKETISGEEFMKIFNESDAKENFDSEEPISTEKNLNSDEPINTENTNSDEPINTEEKTKDDEASKTENIDDTNEEYKE